MSWRPWEDSYFPPPGYPPLHDRLPFHPQNRQQNAPSPRHSSSSSSNDAPSEPTIDLSSWSPRSHPLMNTRQSKLANSSPHSKPRFDLPISTFSAQTVTPIDIQQIYSGFVTKNQTLKSRTHWIFSLMRFDVLPTSRPLSINLFSFLRATSEQNRTLGAPTKPTLTAMTDRHCSVAIVLGRQPHQKRDTLLALLASSTYDPQLVPSHSSAQSDQHESPQRPKMISSHLITSGLNHPFTRQSPLSPNSQDVKNQVLNLQSPSSPSPFVSPDPLILHSGDHQRSLSPPGLDHTHLDLSSTQQNLPHDSPQQHRSSQQQQTTLSQPCQHPLSNLTAPQSLSTKHRNLLKPMATRKSQRILTKQKLSSTVPKVPQKATTKKAQLPFHKDSYETPLDTPMVLAVLQATGLQINEQVQQMIDQAAQIDTAPPLGLQSRPLTPLHDSTPPRTVPGIDLPL